MKEHVEKFQELERKISQEKGDFNLFALFLREDAQDKWDLVVAAPWAETNQKEAYSYLAAQLKKHFNPSDLVKISRIAIVNRDNPDLEAVTRVIRVEHGIVDVQDSNFFGLQIKHAYIITSRRPDVGATAPAT